MRPAARLIVIGEGLKDSVIEIGDSLVIGRSPLNELVLEDDRISRRHAEIRWGAANLYRLTDLGSTNGTWINGRRLTTPSVLQTGDLIQIGAVQLRFEMDAIPPEESSCEGKTATQLQGQRVVVLVTDIRNYTSMTEAMPGEALCRFVRDWFREGARLVESRGGMIDKYIGDAVMCYWRISDSKNPEKEAAAAVCAARDLVRAAKLFSPRLSEIIVGRSFQIGIGISMGDALLGNVGTATNQSLTIVGDCVNVAFRLESLTKEKQETVIVTRNVAENCSSDFCFADLGQVFVKGRRKPVWVSALILD